MLNNSLEKRPAVTSLVVAGGTALLSGPAADGIRQLTKYLVDNFKFPVGDIAHLINPHEKKPTPNNASNITSPTFFNERQAPSPENFTGSSVLGMSGDAIGIFLIAMLAIYCCLAPREKQKYDRLEESDVYNSESSKSLPGLGFRSNEV